MTLLRKDMASPKHNQPSSSDRLRAKLAPKVAALQALGVPALLERFGRGEVISATDPAVLALHATATFYSSAVVATLGVGPGKLPSGTLRNLLWVVGWELTRVGRIHTRGEDRGAGTYTATRVALPAGVSWEALTAKWLAELGIDNHDG